MENTYAKGYVVTLLDIAIDHLYELSNNGLYQKSIFNPRQHDSIKEIVEKLNQISNEIK